MHITKKSDTEKSLVALMATINLYRTKVAYAATQVKV
jgi:hypothetical protein